METPSPASQGCSPYGVATKPLERTSPWEQHGTGAGEKGWPWHSEVPKQDRVRLCTPPLWGTAAVFPVLDLALSRKTGKTLKSLQGRSGRQEMDRCKTGMLPTDERSLWSFTLELSIMEYGDTQPDVLAQVSQSRVNAGQEAHLKYPDKISCLASYISTSAVLMHLPITVPF